MSLSFIAGLDTAYLQQLLWMLDYPGRWPIGPLVPGLVDVTVIC